MNGQAVEAKVYSSTNRLTVVAAMPGLEASQISVRMAGELLTVETDGGSPARNVWRVALPCAVNAAAAMAVYSYGVLVVAIPLAQPGGPALDKLGPGLVKPSRGRSGTQLSPNPVVRRPEGR